MSIGQEHQRTRRHGIRWLATVATCGVVAALPAGCGLAGEEAPRNVIIMIGDGMGFNQIDMASLYEWGTSNWQVSVDPMTRTATQQPRTSSQPFEQFDVQAAVSTFSVDGGYDPARAWSDDGYLDDAPTDSAAAATALASGVKTYDAGIGVGPDRQEVQLVTERAAELGKATGVVTSVPVSHATPGGFSAHDVERDNFHQIATDMLRSDVDVIIGAGHPLYDDDHRSAKPKYKYISKGSWKALTGSMTPFTFMETRADFEALAAAEDPPDRVFGVTQVATTLQARRSGDLAAAPYTDPANDVPDLATLARGALNVLGRDPDGLFLLIEGGAIDWACHDNSAGRLIEEELAFAEAVRAVSDWVEEESSWDETLVIVTADHETGHLMAPGSETGWRPLTGTRGQVPTHEWGSEKHTNSLVPLFAEGAGAQALAERADAIDPVRGQYLDNTDIGQVILADFWAEG